MVDVGDLGRQSDGSVYNNSHLGYAIEHNKLNFPDPERASMHYDKVLPFVFVADDAFGLKTYMMKPYPNRNIPLDQMIFNYRLSRARRIIENTFGIATSRFRVFRRPIIAKVGKAILITKAVVALHNYLMRKHSQGNFSYCPPNYTDTDGPSGFTQGEWRKEMSTTSALEAIPQMCSNNYSREAKQVRDDFREYFCSSEGSVGWQLNMVTRTA